MPAKAVLIVGESGSGKSTASETLPPEQTFYINVASKDLPYRRWKTNYKEFNKENIHGNLINTTDGAVILNTLDYISAKRPEIKYIVIDDNQYIAADYLMQKAKETGYGKFTDAALVIYKIATKSRSMRDDLIVFILNHAEEIPESGGKLKAKTAGRMIDNQITYEGLFTTVLFAYKEESKNGANYGFITNGDPLNTAKSPKDLFESNRIPNDLFLVANSIREYEI